MEKKKSLSISHRIKSFHFAFSGLFDMLKTEPSAWIHATATVIVLTLALWLQLDILRLALIVMAIVSVWVAEAFNTVLEILVDNLSQSFSLQAKRAKDIAAAAVLITAIGAAFMGVVLLGPPLVDRLFG